MVWGRSDVIDAQCILPCDMLASEWTYVVGLINIEPIMSCPWVLSTVLCYHAYGHVLRREAAQCD